MEATTKVSRIEARPKRKETMLGEICKIDYICMVTEIDPILEREEDDSCRFCFCHRSIAASLLAYGV